ncbi:MAG: hypothetical protein ACI8UR_001856 [Natronomonas sp.]|jgi:hypothetical protein|uniref:hypothetical protein n=1 Tax=Natronomonas sp. TaxID=2184060 RepID=UPI00398948C2
MAPISASWNDILTLVTFISTIVLAGYQIRYYRNQKPSLQIVEITDAEYRDFDKYTEYDFTIQLKNDGRDPVSIPNAKLSIRDETIDLHNKLAPKSSQNQLIRVGDFDKVRLESMDSDVFEMFGDGSLVETTKPIEGTVCFDTSIGNKETAITFERAS